MHNPLGRVDNRDFVGFRVRHARTAALWHRRHQLERPSKALLFVGKAA
jgi:hypothetical protein